MTGEEAKQKWSRQYRRQNDHIKANYDRVNILLPKGAKDAIKATGESLNAYFNRLYAEDMERRGMATYKAHTAPETSTGTNAHGITENATTGRTEGHKATRKRTAAPAEELDPINAAAGPEKPGELDPAEHPPTTGPAEDPAKAADSTGPENWTPGPAFLFGSFDMDPAELPFK